MPRSHWKGIISFGLVSIPIILHPSENKSADISFHQIDKRNNARIKYQRVNAVTNKIVPWEDVIKGYEYDKDTIVPVPNDVLKKVAGENARTIDIETFIDKKDLDFITIANTYYLTPDKKGEKGYVILREALATTNKIGITKVIISTKEYLASIMPYKNALILCLLKYAKEVRNISELAIPTKELSTYKIKPNELFIAKQLIKSMTSKWHPDKYLDEYQESIHQWVKETVNKLPHTKIKQHAHPRTNVVNFVDLLKKSLSAHERTSIKKKKSAKHSHHLAKKNLKSAKHLVKH